MTHRVLTLPPSSIAHGRLYFPSSDIKFFPSNSFGDRASSGWKGEPVTFRAGPLVYVDFIRILSSKRLSPRCSFAQYLESVGATAGGKIRVERLAEKVYELHYLGVDA